MNYILTFRTLTSLVTYWVKPNLKANFYASKFKFPTSKRHTSSCKPFELTKSSQIIHIFKKQTHCLIQLGKHTLYINREGDPSSMTLTHRKFVYCCIACILMTSTTLNWVYHTFHFKTWKSSAQFCRVAVPCYLVEDFCLH